MNSRQRYRMKYPGWFIEAAKGLLTRRMVEDVVYGLFCLVFLLTFPVSLPVVTVIRMVVTKRKLRDEFGHEKLMRDD